MKSHAPLLLSLSLGCTISGPAPSPLAWTEDTGGPRVVFDLEARPLPEIPLPNDVATRFDPTSPTGRRLSVSEQATTRYEARTRRAFNTLDGFGSYAPITVAFDRPLALEPLRRAHADDDFRDDAVFLLNVDRRCTRFGEEVALDLGRGRFPVTLFRRARKVPDPLAPDGYRIPRGGLFSMDEFDPHGVANNLLFEEHHEDLDGDGALDPGEDEDADGVLDAPNFADPEACRRLAPRTRTGTVNAAHAPVAYDRCVADHLLTWYERESDTLVLRPVWPLEERCTYAVVLTRRVTGVDGAPIVSPFVAVHHRDQRAALDGVPDLLARYGLGAADIAFAWTFTVGTMTADYLALRDGLYGRGPFARLAAEFPPSALELWRAPPPRDAAVLTGGCAANAVSRLWRLQGEWAPNRCAIEADMASIGAMFGGRFAAPDLLVDKDGLATPRYPHTQDERWVLDAARGEAVYGRGEVSFWCALPKATRTDCAPGNPDGVPFCKPFPVLLYAHGYGGSRAEMASGHMGRAASMGYALCGLDAYGHGLNRLLEAERSLEASVFRGRLERELGDLGVAAFSELLMRGRDRDLDNDGVADPGGDMWTSDAFHTRDMVRQTTLEYAQFVRVLRAMDGRATDAAGALLGDVDGDGVVDLGGPQNTVSMWGISLGGIIGGVLAGAEPGLDAVSPNAGGAGLVDIAVRSSQAGVPEAVVMPLMGPFIEGCLAVDAHDRPTPDGTVGRGCFSEALEGGQLEWGFRLSRLSRSVTLRAGVVPGVRVGDRLTLINLSNGERGEAFVSARGTFRVAVAADALAPISRRALFGVADDDTSPMVATPDRVDALGDRLRLVITAPDGVVRATLDAFGEPVSFMGTLYPAGLPLVALQEGLGLPRNSPRFRRFLGFAALATAPADPASWMAHRLDHGTGDPTRPAHPALLAMPTAGDPQVPVNTGIAMARAAGLLGDWRRRPDQYPAEQGWRALFAPDPRLGVAPDALLVDRFVVEGDPRLERFPENPVHARVLYDVDDVSDGAAAWSCGASDWSATAGESGCPDALIGQEIFFSVPRQTPPLRRDTPRTDGRFDAIRVPVLRPAGQHGIYNAQSFRRFDADAFMVSFTTRFLGTRGRRVDHPRGCDCSASQLPSYVLGGTPAYPSLERACTSADLKLCSPSCAEAWGLANPERTSCDPPTR
jgi:hypothetical protein